MEQIETLETIVTRACMWVRCTQRYHKSLYHEAGRRKANREIIKNGF